MLEALASWYSGQTEAWEAVAEDEARGEPASPWNPSREVLRRSVRACHPRCSQRTGHPRFIRGPGGDGEDLMLRFAYRLPSRTNEMHQVCMHMQTRCVTLVP